MANDFYNELNANPMWQQGLAMMRGENPSVALDRASAAQTMMAQEQERQRREQTRKALGQALSGGLTPEKINDIMAIDPEMGLKLLEHMRLQQQQDRLLREQQMMESLVSGGIGEIGDAAGYILAGSDNPIMRGIGESRIEDIKTQRDIDKENRKKFAEEEKMRKEAFIPDFELQEGAIPAKTDVSKAKQMLSDKESFIKTLDEMESLFDEYGGVTETFNPTAAAKYRTKQKQIALAAKGLFELGALQAPDIELIAQMQIDPVGKEAAYRIDPSAIKQSINSLRGFVNDKVNSRMSGLGYKQLGGTSSTAPTDLSTMTDEQLQAERAMLLRKGGN